MFVQNYHGELLIKQGFAMKNKSLKHCKRKKFFYRFFMRHTPLSGAMFGMAWMICFGAILPLALWLFAEITPNWAADSTFNAIIWTLAAFLFFSVCLLTYGYGFLTFAKNFYTILRNDLKKSRFWKLPAFISAAWYELAGILLLPIAIKKKRWTVLVFILASFGFGFLGFMLDTPLQKWWCFHFGVAFLLFCAIGASCKDEKFQWKSVYPLLGFGIFIAALGVGDFYFHTQIKRSQCELSQIARRGIFAADWQKRNSFGYSINNEPLKSFCKINMKIDMEKYQIPSEAEKYLSELRKTQADKFLAIEKLLELKPQRIAYNWVEPGETLACLLLPDLQCFRTAAQLRTLEIRANAADKTVVAKCNQDLLKLREWCVYNETLLSKLVAGAMDNLRLYALSYAMASGVYSKEEMTKLIGDVPDWSRQFSETFASENALTEEIINLLKIASAKDIQGLKICKFAKFSWKYYQKFAPLFAKINLKRDYLFTLNYYLKINSLLYRDDLSGLEKRKLAHFNRDRLEAECFISSSIAIPDFSNLLVRIDRTRDVRQMALLAAEVMEYRNLHGRLPEDLSFLPEMPLSKLDHKPLMYKKTTDGFRIFSHNDKGEKPDEKDIAYSYRVRLPETCRTFPLTDNVRANTHI